MTTSMIVLDAWPVTDVPAAAAALVACVGGTVTDRAAQLRACRGILAEGLSPTAAEAMARALTSAGCHGRSAPDALVATLPRPVTSRRLDPRDVEQLEATVRMTGPAQRIAHQRILALVPALWSEATLAGGAAAPRGGSMVKTAVSLATTGGVGMLFKGKAKPAEAQRQASTSAWPMLEIIAVGGVRIQAFAHRMDYSVLGRAGARGEDNWRLLVRALRRRARPTVAGGELVDAWLADGQVPRWLQVADNNDLGRSIRWLMLRSALVRLDDRG